MVLLLARVEGVDLELRVILGGCCCLLVGSPYAFRRVLLTTFDKCLLG